MKSDNMITTESGPICLRCRWCGPWDDWDNVDESAYTKVSTCRAPFPATVSLLMDYPNGDRDMLYKSLLLWELKNIFNEPVLIVTADDYGYDSRVPTNIIARCPAWTRKVTPNED